MQRDINLYAHEWLLIQLRQKKRSLDNAERRKGAEGYCAECEKKNLKKQIDNIEYLRDLVVRYGNVPFVPMTLQEVCHCDDDDPIYCEYRRPEDAAVCVPVWGKQAKEIIEMEEFLCYGRAYRFWFGRKPTEAECRSAEWEE